LDVAERLPAVRSGQGDLEQLVLNLASNARDAMPDGGVFSVRAWPQERGVGVCVADTGCGIPPELLSRVQEPFITTKQEGSGLGLAICRSIIWEMRGRMEINSKPGEGTQVVLHLPAAE
ncbi:MAG: ATP-binding protein, partial [Phycisphaerae bacterium]|nr:ATP-binding protein [Phycisphaerae bacterium]